MCGWCRFPQSFCPVQGDGARTSITLDFGDGHALTYSNVSSIEDGIKHIYKAVGIYRVTATGENSLGSETVMLYLHVTCEILRSYVCLKMCIYIYLDRRICNFWALTLSASHFLSHAVELRLSARTHCSTFCALSLHRTCSPPITKQTSEIEQIPLHFHSSRLMLRRRSACGSHCSLICNGADHPRCIQGVTDVTELTYWSGSAVAPANLSILCARRTNRATAGSGVPRMKNNTQMAANGPSAGLNSEQTRPPRPPINPLSTLFFL